MKILEREDSREILEHALREARSGEGRVAFIAGEAGIGKTTLVESFARAHVGRDRVLWGHCEALSAPRPLGPILDIARHLGGDMRSLMAEATVSDILPALLHEFRRPAILVIEDAHWADDATLDLIKVLGRRIQNVPLLLIVTYRDDEIHRAHPLRGVLGALATCRAGRRITLAPLTLDAVCRLVGDASLDARVLHAQTGGNPFLISEVLAEGGTGAVPGAVLDLVLGRMARLPEHARTLLETAAVIGARADTALLDSFVSGAAEAAEACVSLGLLRSQDRTLVFRHELVRQAVLDAMTAPGLAAMHARVLRALTARGEQDPARLSHHAYSAGDAEAVRRHAAAAARQAASAGANREATVQFQRALRYTSSALPEERAPLLEGFAAAASILDRQEEAVAARREAAALWRCLGNAAKEGGNLAAAAEPLVRCGRNVEADAVAREGISILERLGPSRELAAALRVQAHLRMLDRDTPQALHFGRRAIAMAREVDDPESLVGGNIAVGAAMLVSDDPRGRPYLMRSLALARSNGLEALVSLAYGNLGSAYGEQYRFPDAERFLSEGLAHAGEHDLDYTHLYMLAWLALTHLYQGRWVETVEAALRVLAVEDVAAISRIMALVALARVRARRGEAGVDALLDEALDLAAPTCTLQRLAPVRTARAEAAWLAGDVARAGAEAEAVWELALAHRHQWHVGECAYWRVLSGEQVQVPACAARPYALQIRHRWGDAARIWEDRGCPYERARALAEGDESARRTALRIFDNLGAGPAADALRQRMRREGVVHIPRGPRPKTRAHAFGLTAREAQILPLLAEGLTNAAIAHRLHISTKTVDHHVSAILDKLGVSSRVEAATLASKGPAASAQSGQRSTPR